MKKLSNVSPFLLLLLPVFIMMIFTMTTNKVVDNSNEVAVKTVSAKVSLIK